MSQFREQSEERRHVHGKGDIEESLNNNQPDDVPPRHSLHRWEKHQHQRIGRPEGTDGQERNLPAAPVGGAVDPTGDQRICHSIENLPEAALSVSTFKTPRKVTVVVSGGRPALSGGR